MTESGRDRENDLLRAWQEAWARLVPATAAGGAQAELVRQLFAPFERQAELLQLALRQQGELQRDQVRRFFEPLRELIRLIEQGTAPMRQGAESFAQAAAALERVGQMLDRQAAMMEGTTAALRQQLDLLTDLAGMGLAERREPDAPERRPSSPGG